MTDTGQATSTEVAFEDAASGLRFPEGPVAMDDGSVLVVEIEAGRLTRVTPDGGVVAVAECGGGPNGAARGPDGHIYVCNNGGFAWRDDIPGLLVPAGHSEDTYTGGRLERIDPETGDVEVLYGECDGRPLLALNDLVFDRTGGFWFTDSGLRHERTQDFGGVYYAAADGSSITEVIFPLDCANGIALSPDEDRLYVADSIMGRIWYWELSGPGEVVEVPGFVPGGGNLLTTLPGMQPLDSMAVEAGGNVCVATVVQGTITVVTPDGEILEQVPTGDPLTTNLCFGGPDMRDVFVTAGGTGRLLRARWPRPGLKLPW